MPRGNLFDLPDGGWGVHHDRDAATLRHRPQPVRGSLKQHLPMLGNVEREADAEHPRLIFPAGNTRAAFGTLNGEAAHCHETIGMGLCRFQDEIVVVTFPCGREYHGAMYA